PTVASKPPSGPGWAHELKHDGYRLQIHVREGRVRLFTMNGADWTKRYPRIVKEASRLRAPLIIDAEVVCLDSKGIPDFDSLHIQTSDPEAVAPLLARVTTSGVSHSSRARRRYSGSSANRATAFSTSNTPRATDRKCLLPPASSAWRGLSPS